MNTCTQQLMLPKNVRNIGSDETFSFLCHPGIACFTHCCRQLDLILTPYDILRLKNAAGLISSDFLSQYVIREKNESDTFPSLYLTMVDDGKASCIFVSKQGCTFYEDRPGACRAYPMGRAVRLKNQNTLDEFFVLLEEEHCQGFSQHQQQNPKKYGQDQGLSPYNRFNDAVAAILQHKRIKDGMILSAEQIEAYLLSLYDLDTFREMILTDRLPHAPLDAKLKHELEDDEHLLLFAIAWLSDFLFG